MSARSDLLAACATGDRLTVRRLGWWRTFDALEMWWPKAFDSGSFAAYVDLLGDQDSDAVYEALRSLGGSKFRPAPSEILRQLRDLGAANAAAGESGTERRDRLNRRVRRLLTNGTDPCCCVGVPHPPVRLVDGLEFCAVCDGIDPATAEIAVEQLLPAEPCVSADAIPTVAPRAVNRDAMRTSGDVHRDLLARLDPGTTAEARS